MKKTLLREVTMKVRAQLAVVAAERDALRYDVLSSGNEVRALNAELKMMRTHWRPIPIVHEWEPRDSRCALCDEPRDNTRHQVDS